MTTEIRAEEFPDLDDEVMYPRLPAKKIERLAQEGTPRTFAAGEVLSEQGVRESPFIVIVAGRVRILDRKPGKDVWVAEDDAGTFLGDIATFTGSRRSPPTWRPSRRTRSSSTGPRCGGCSPLGPRWPRWCCAR